MAELQRLNIYKPPPPYPGNRGAGGGTGGQQGVKMMMSSTSTPDLASVASTSINNYNNLVSAAATSGGVNGNNYPMGGHLHYSRSGHFLLTWICHWGVYCRGFYFTLFLRTEEHLVLISLEFLDVLFSFS